MTCVPYPIATAVPEVSPHFLQRDPPHTTGTQPGHRSNADRTYYLDYLHGSDPTQRVSLVPHICLLSISSGIRNSRIRFHHTQNRRDIVAARSDAFGNPPTSILLSPGGHMDQSLNSQCTASQLSRHGLGNSETRKLRRHGLGSKSPKGGLGPPDLRGSNKGTVSFFCSVFW